MGNISNMERAQLGARIRHLRKEQGLSQRKLALMVGIDRTYLIAVEQGKRNIALDNIVRIAGGLGISLSELFEGVGISSVDNMRRSDINVVSINLKS